MKAAACADRPLAAPAAPAFRLAKDFREAEDDDRDQDVPETADWRCRQLLGSWNGLRDASADAAKSQAPKGKQSAGAGSVIGGAG